MHHLNRVTFAMRPMSGVRAAMLGCGVVLTMVLSSATLGAQTLPTAPGDSVTRWAVDPANAGGAGMVVLLDALDAHVEPDGTGRRTMRSVVQVLQQSAVNGAAERRFSWQPSRQDMQLDWVRVLRPDGTVLSNVPSTDQTGDATASMQNPIYVDSRTRRISLGGVAPNTIVDVQYTIVDSAPWRPGDFYIGWRFTPPSPLRVSQLRVSVPLAFRPAIREQNLTFSRTETEQDGRRIYEWRAMQPQVVRPAPFAPDSDGVRMSVTVAAPQPWDSVTHWYHGLTRDRYTADAVLIAQLDSVARGAATRDDSLRALHKWIAQDIRYVSVSLGLGGYQPRTPAEVMRTGYGDCKDKTSLFIAAARHWGIDARPVLLHLSGVRDPRPVAIARFNHVIAAIADAAGRYTYTDLTAATIPYAQLPVSYRGTFGVVVRPNGLADTIRFPSRDADSTGSRLRLTGTLSPEGRMDLIVDDAPLGDLAWALRNAFASPLDSTRRATGLRTLAATYLPESTGDSLQAFDGRDFAQTPRVRVVLLNGRGARAAGPVWLLHLPGPFRQLAGGTANSAREIDAQARRVLPVDSRMIVGPRTMEAEYRVTLPAGWEAQLPPPTVATSFFARYESSYRQEGRELIMKRVLRGTDAGVHAPERIVEVSAWMRAVSADDLEFITLTPAGQ